MCDELKINFKKIKRDKTKSEKSKKYFYLPKWILIKVLLAGEFKRGMEK